MSTMLSKAPIQNVITDRYGRVSRPWAQFFTGLVRWVTGSLTAQAFVTAPVQFVNLPVVPAAGMMAAISDSPTETWGDPILAGGGTFTVMAYYGANFQWTVMGKS